jgi:CRISPR/Cas system endoribonuclease Cas6 (RAMP superfamily)
MLALLHGRGRLELDYRGLISRAGEVKTVTSSLRWDDLERYSNRQKTKMKLGGFVGEVEYAGEAIEEFLPLVAAGEILHVGAGTSFGLGRYRIVAEDQV